MCLKNWCALFLLLSVTGVCAAANPVVPTTTLAAQTSNNTSAASSFATQSNGNAGAANVSKVDVHTLLYLGATTKVYAHLLVWFGKSDNMNVGYSSIDSKQVRRQVMDMISRGIDGVIIDWYGAGDWTDQASLLVMKEAELHPGFTFAIMIDKGTIQWHSCSGCSPQQALISQLQYVEQTYFSSPAYMRIQGRPVITDFGIDESYSVNWDQVATALPTQPEFIFENNGGFTHAVTDGSYSWVMPETSDYGMGYLTSFYDAGMAAPKEETVGATYKGFNDTLASWGSNRIMGQQCAQTWLQTFDKINSLYNSGKQLPYLQLVTWNDYEEATEIESGIDNCLSVSASSSGNSLKWSIKGDESTIDHYVAYVSTDGQNLMSLAEPQVGIRSLNLCSYSIGDGKYTFYVQAVGKPSIRNQISGAVTTTLACGTTNPPSGGGNSTIAVGATPSAITIASGNSGKVTVQVTPVSGTFNNAVALTCGGLPSTLQCSFAPSSVVPGASAVSSVLTVTAASSSASAAHHELRRFLLAMFFGFGAFGLVFVGNVDGRRRIRLIGVGILTVLVLMTVACGGGKSATGLQSSSSPNTRNYVVTINASAGSVQLSTPVTITVN
ncbi:MAG TPA: hypothetical protein VMU05_09070 [Dongiaceae bacterium]|nr:hypothetical protein [Dongiaceae bacterium]